MELIVDRHRPGRENMAIDVALLERGEPVIRLYGWSPACLSLGYTQTLDEVDAAALEAHGLDHVERPTGGGAILHMESEVTYAVVLPTGFPGLPDELFASYEFMADGVLQALGDLGLAAEYKKATGGKDAFCYLREAGVSVVVDGRKISGGAQRRTKHAVLQHGTVLVENDVTLQADVFDQDPERIRSGVTSLQDLGIGVDRDELVRLIAEGYRKTYQPDAWVERGPEALDELRPQARG